MKALVINGSPKGKQSNSLKLANSFVRGMGIGEVSICHLKDLEIKDCQGCFGCWKVTPGKCVINDDAAQVLAELLQADVIIWSFPLYYYTVPGLMKNLINRQLPLLLPFMAEREDGVGNGSHSARYNREWQKHVLISTCGFWTAADNYDAVLRMFDHICGKDGYTALFCGQGELFSVPQLKEHTGDYLKLVEQAGREYMQGRITDTIEAQLREPLFPKAVFEEMADASWGMEKEPLAEGESRKGLSLTRQMAALYRPDAYDGKERVLEFCYTDIDETYQIVMGKDGYQFLTEGFRAYTTRIETAFTIWNDISMGIISGEEALARHQYRVVGDFDIMLKWDKFFYGGKGVSDSSRVPEAGKSKKTNMKLLLLPWIIFWIVADIDPYRGGIAGILAAAAIPLLWVKYQATIYEYLTILLVSLFSLTAVLGANMEYIIPVSDGMFGVLWLASVFCPIPLTAHYSMYSYGGRKVLDNPLFMKTNRILTCCWGVLYLAMPVWTLMIMRSSAAGWCGLFNSMLPIVLGFFTTWFQKWYPRRMAGIC